MKLKYYLRGLGIGIIVTTIVLTVSFCGRDTVRELSDEEIIARAMELGMVMPEQGTDEEGSGDTQVDPDTGGDTENAPERPDDDIEEPPYRPSASGEDVPDGVENAPVREGVYRLVIERGDVCRVVCEKLAENGVIADAEALRTYLFELGYASNMSIGSYDVPYGLTNEQIAQVLMAGPIPEDGE